MRQNDNFHGHKTTNLKTKIIYKKLITGEKTQLFCLIFILLICELYFYKLQA